MSHREVNVQKHLKFSDNDDSQYAYTHALNLYLLIDVYFMLSTLLGAEEPNKVLSLKEIIPNHLTKFKGLTNIH